VTVRQLIREALATMTQVALAEELTRRGLPTRQPHISRWLSGRRPMRRATEIVLRQMLEAILAETDARQSGGCCCQAVRNDRSAGADRDRGDAGPRPTGSPRTAAPDTRRPLLGADRTGSASRCHPPRSRFRGADGASR
jgi:hypothetical protein